MLYSNHSRAVLQKGMCSQLPQLDQQLKAAVCDMRPTAGANNCSVFSLLLCPFKMVCSFFLLRDSGSAAETSRPEMKCWASAPLSHGPACSISIILFALCPWLEQPLVLSAQSWQQVGWPLESPPWDVTLHSSVSCLNVSRLFLER